MGMLSNMGSHHPGNEAIDYMVKPWYSRPWNAVLRPNNKELAKLCANMAIAGANNNNIYYIYGGTSYYPALQRAGNDPAAIKERCGTDCMGAVFAVIKGAMARLGIKENLPLLGCSNADQLLSYGYTKFTDSDHINSDRYAERGDVYVNYSLHASMHVGDGQLNGYDGSDTSGVSGTGGSGGTGVSIDYNNMSPYFIGIPENVTKFDVKMFKESQVSGVMLRAGYLYNSAHIKRDKYISQYLDKQVKCAEDGDIPYALCAEVRAHSVAEAQDECDKLYYVAAAYVPRMSLWLHLDMKQSKSVNERILDYYYETLSGWGFKNTMGLYVTQSELDQITWDKYKDKFYLWKVDHTQDISKWVNTVPFAVITPGGGGPIGSSNGTDGGVTGSGGQEYQTSSTDQKRIVDACSQVGWPGASLCATWTSRVYAKAGFGYPSGNACDQYYKYCKYSDRNMLKVGMFIAVATHPHTSAGRIYGHVGIYIGDGKVMHSLGDGVKTWSVDKWISYYGVTCTPRWGFAGNVNAN